MNIFVTSLLKIINNSDIKSTEYNITYYLLVNYDEVSNMTINELAEATYVSVSALTRFFNIVGFNKFALTKQLMAIDKETRLFQLKERCENKNYQQVYKLLKTYLTKEDYDDISSSDLINKYCLMIDKCKRIVFMDSNEMMDSLLRIQGDLTVMNSLMIQNTIYPSNFISVDENDLVIVFSMTGRIVELQSEIINDTITCLSK